jgi:hypothetical protein
VEYLIRTTNNVAIFFAGIDIYSLGEPEI